MEQKTKLVFCTWKKYSILRFIIPGSERQSPYVWCVIISHRQLPEIITDWWNGKQFLKLWYLPFPSLLWLLMLSWRDIRRLMVGIRPWPWVKLLMQVITSYSSSSQLYLTKQNESFSNFLLGLSERVRHLLHLDHAAQARGYLGNTTDAND